MESDCGLNPFSVMERSFEDRGGYLRSFISQHTGEVLKWSGHTICFLAIDKVHRAAVGGGLLINDHPPNSRGRPVDHL